MDDTIRALYQWVDNLTKEMDDLRVSIPANNESFRMMHLRTAAACLEMEKVRKELEAMK